MPGPILKEDLPGRESLAERAYLEAAQDAPAKEPEGIPILSPEHAVEARHVAHLYRLVAITLEYLPVQTRPELYAALVSGARRFLNEANEDLRVLVRELPRVEGSDTFPAQAPDPDRRERAG